MNKYGISQEEFDLLPEELRKQLSGVKRGRERTVSASYLKIIGAHGPCGINRLMIELYKTTGRVPLRATVLNNLHNLVVRGDVSRPSRGIYVLAQEGAK
jgi:hypothetical protein